MNFNIKDESHKSPDQLEREIDMRRSHIVDTLDELGNRLSPRHLIDETSDYIRDNAGVLSRNVSNVVSNNPGPILLTAAGLAWMLVSARSRHAANSIDDSADYYGEYEYGIFGEYYDSDELDMNESLDLGAEAPVGESSSDAANQAKYKLDSVKEKARQKAAQMQRKARQGKRAVRQQSQRIASDFESLVHRQPLVAGAVGLALGALIAASIAPTRSENRLMGPTRDRLKEQARAAAKDAGRQAEAKAKVAAEKIQEDIKQAVRQDTPPVTA